MRTTRTVGAVAVLALVLLLAACGGSQPAPAKPTVPAPSTPAPAPPKAQAPAPAPTPAPAPAPAAKVDYPTRPVEMIVPATAGGGLDITARIIAKAAEKQLGQPINVVNVPGGGTSIGYTRFVGSKPDGYTTAIIYNALLIHNLTLPGVTYKAENFEPVILVSTDANVLAVKKGSPLDLPLDKFLPYLKANADKISFAVGGKWTGSDLAGTALQEALKTPLNKVYFDGGAPAVAALLAGDVHMVAQYYAELRPHIEAGKLTAIATLSRGKHPNLKDLPVMKETGLDVVGEIWRGFAVPKGTPAAIVAKLHDAFKAAIDDPAVKAELDKAAIHVRYGSTADLKQLMIDDEKADGARVKAILAKGAGS